MILHTTVNYSDIYDGFKPTINELLEEIPSEAIIMILCAINSELYSSKDFEETQVRMTKFITQRFSQEDNFFLVQKLRAFQKKTNANPIIWGRRYVLEFMKHEFLNYRDLKGIELTPAYEINIFKAYLLIAEKLNLKDGVELRKTTLAIKKND